MKRLLSATALVLAFGAASLDADAARRFGGGGFLGKQRAVPAQRQATPPQQQATPAQQKAAPAQQPAPAAAGAAAAAKPGFMGRWGGLLAGLGIGALLASLFGAQLGPIVGLILAALLGFGIVFLLARLFAGNRAGPPTAGTGGRSPQFAGIGANVRHDPPMDFEAPPSAPMAASSRGTALALPADFDVQAFQRVAKTSFIRLQAANDAGDLDDIRDYTTPEVYAEIAMQVKERGQPQKVEVVNVEAQLVDFATEGKHDYASVRFYGLIREEPGANPEPFDEVWHVRRKAGDKRDAWLIAGIQQAPA